MFGYAGWETMHEEKSRVLLIEGGSELEAGIPPNLGILVASINNSGHSVRVFSLNDYKSQMQTGDEIRINTLQVPPSQEDVIYKVKDTDIKEDFLEVDTPINGQKYVLLSFVSPHKIIKRRIW